MGLLTDALQSAVQSKVEGKIEDAMERQGAEARKKDNVVVRFFVSFFWLLVNLAITAFVLFTFFTQGNEKALIVGIIASSVMIFLTLVIPYLRRGSWTRWFGFWLPLADALWWAYLLIFD